MCCARTSSRVIQQQQQQQQLVKQILGDRKPLKKRCFGEWTPSREKKKKNLFKNTTGNSFVCSYARREDSLSLRSMFTASSSKTWNQIPNIYKGKKKKVQRECRLHEVMHLWSFPTSANTKERHVEGKQKKANKKSHVQKPKGHSICSWNRSFVSPEVCN